MPTSPEVDAWFEAYDNPMKDVVLAVRAAVLETDDRITECIKWKAPTFVFKGNIASFFPKSKKHASLMFHQGAKIPGDFAVLEGDGATARNAKFPTVDDVAARKDQLQAVVRAWIDWKS